MSNFYLIAQIKSIYGCEGFLSLFSFSDALDRFNKLKKVFIDVYGAKREFVVDKTDFEDDTWIIKFKNFDSDQDVGFLIGKKIFIDAVDLESLPEDTFYIHDLIGCKVFSENQFFGYLTDVLVLPTNDVYVINDNNGKEILIPALKEYVLSIDTKNKRVDLSSVSGMFLDDEN